MGPWVHFYVAIRVILQKNCVSLSPFLIKGRNTIAIHFRLPNAANYYLWFLRRKNARVSTGLLPFFSGIITSEL